MTSDFLSHCAVMPGLLWMPLAVRCWPPMACDKKAWKRSDEHVVETTCWIRKFSWEEILSALQTRGFILGESIHLQDVGAIVELCEQLCGLDKQVWVSLAPKQTCWSLCYSWLFTWTIWSDILVTDDLLLPVVNFLGKFKSMSLLRDNGLFCHTTLHKTKKF